MWINYSKYHRNWHENGEEIERKWTQNQKGVRQQKALVAAKAASRQVQPENGVERRVHPHAVFKCRLNTGPFWSTIYYFVGMSFDRNTEPVQQGLSSEDNDKCQCLLIPISIQCSCVIKQSHIFTVKRLLHYTHMSPIELIHKFLRYLNGSHYRPLLDPPFDPRTTWTISWLDWKLIWR